MKELTYDNLKDNDDPDITPGLHEPLVIDDAIDQMAFIEIKRWIVEGDFPWFLQKDVVSETEYTDEGQPTEEVLCDQYDNLQFQHSFYSDKNFHTEACNPMWAPVLARLRSKALVRIKANLTLRTESVIKHGWHRDASPPEHYPGLRTAVYYLNTCDGFTELKETGQKIYSKENRLAVFPNHMFHTGTTTTNDFGRYVVNFNTY